MRLFFRLLYHSFAWAYDLVSSTVSLGRWNQWVNAAGSLLTGPRVLELGYGPGHLQTYLRTAGFIPFGLDESDQMARQAFRRLSRQGYTPFLSRGLAQSLPFADQSFDSVVATFPTPYIVDPLTLAEIKRVLKPTADMRSGKSRREGGRLVVLTAAWITGRSLPDRMMRTLFRVADQAPSEDQALGELIEPYTNAGFNAQVRFVEVPGKQGRSTSRLMFILATRKE